MQVEVFLSILPARTQTFLQLEFSWEVAERVAGFLLGGEVGGKY